MSIDNNNVVENRIKWTEQRIAYEWLSIDANRNKLLHIIVDEATWNAFRNYGSIIDFTEWELEEGLLYASMGGEWVCLKKSKTIV